MKDPLITIYKTRKGKIGFSPNAGFKAMTRQERIEMLEIGISAFKSQLEITLREGATQ